MKLLIFLFALCNAICVIAGGRRPPQESQIIWMGKILQQAAGIPSAKRIIMPGRDTTSFAQDVQLIMRLPYLPFLPNPDPNTDRMALSNYMVRKGYNEDFAPLMQADGVTPRDTEKFVHLVKGANGYVSIFKIVASVAADIRKTNTLEYVDYLLDKLEGNMNEAWHERRADAQKRSLEVLRKMIPENNVKTTKEYFSDGTWYEKWDKKATLDASSPDEQTKIKAWVKKRKNERHVRTHQAPLNAMQLGRSSLDQKCGNPQLPQRRGIMDFNVTMEDF